MKDIKTYMMANNSEYGITIPTVILLITNMFIVTT